MKEGKPFTKCPYDGCRIRMVARHRHWPKLAVRFFWCCWCQKLFAFVGENPFGGRFAATFTFDQLEKCFRLAEATDSAKDVELALEVISEVTFSPSKKIKNETIQ